jgi:hypothetical protein
MLAEGKAVDDSHNSVLVVRVFRFQGIQDFELDMGIVDIESLVAADF